MWPHSWWPEIYSAVVKLSHALKIIIIQVNLFLLNCSLQLTYSIDVSFRHMAKWFSFLYICICVCVCVCILFQILFHYRSLKGTKTLYQINLSNASSLGPKCPWQVIFQILVLCAGCYLLFIPPDSLCVLAIWPEPTTSMCSLALGHLIGFCQSRGPSRGGRGEKKEVRVFIPPAFHLWSHQKMSVPLTQGHSVFQGCPLHMTLSFQVL